MSTLVTDPRPLSEGRPQERGRLYGLMAEFATPGELLRAADTVRKEGFRWWDCHSPFPVHGLDKAMGISPTILPVAVFGAAATGALVGFLLQAFTNSWSFTIWAIVWVTGYPYLISGKPLLSMPAFIPVMFELTILLAATSTVFLMLLFNGLPRLHHPLLKSDRFRRVTDDRFFLVIEARDPKFSRARTESLLRSLHPVAVEAVED
ncbi:MAG TPA: DUF3341 domain-containing protein [Phycisphaerales bacterium]|nr:DUF3341 domain-containing protein [Phycisphaerales bacterium]HMP36017.1 DUF3341 domain-containing protein [Phycisphaerales bacterium]